MRCTDRLLTEHERHGAASRAEDGVKPGACLTDPEHPPVQLHVIRRVRRLLERDHPARNRATALLLVARLVWRDRDEHREPVRIALRREHERHEFDPVAQHQPPVGKPLPELRVPQLGIDILEYRESR